RCSHSCVPHSGRVDHRSPTHSARSSSTNTGTISSGTSGPISGTVAFAVGSTAYGYLSHSSISRSISSQLLPVQSVIQVMTSSYLCVLPSLSTTRASHRRASSEPSVLSTSTIRYPTGSTPASLRNCSTSSGGVPGTATVAVAPPHISAWYTPGPPLS